MLKQKVEHSQNEIKAQAQFDTQLEIKFQAEAKTCDYCSKKLYVYKSQRRRVVTLRYGCFIACETLRFCPEHSYGVKTSGCSPVLPLQVLKYHSQTLQQLVSPRASFGYDIVACIGQARFIYHRQRSEIQSELLAKGIEISTGEISRLSDLFLVYIEQLHLRNANRLRERIAKSGGYVLHLDATGENGSEMLLVCYHGLKNMTLYATKIKSENAEEITGACVKTIELFGPPLAVIHDLGTGMAKTTQALKKMWPEMVDLICEFHFLQDIGKDLIEKDYDTLRKLFRKSRISPNLRRLKKKIGLELDPQNPAVNYFYRRFNKGNFTELDHLNTNRALIYAMINWILDYKSESKGLGFPFEQPYMAFFNRCHTIGTMAKKLLKNKYFEDESIRDDLLKIYHIVEKIYVDKRFKIQVSRILENVTLFNELRNTQRLFNDEKQGINGCRSFSSKEELNDVEKRLHEYIQSLEKRLLNEKLTNSTQRAIKIILKHLDKYQAQLFGRVFEFEIDGQKKLMIADRTNNCLEQFFRNIKRFLRRTTGRKNLQRDFNGLPAQVALTPNLLNEDYVATILGSLENLPILFSQLDQQYCKEQLKLLHVQRTGELVNAKSIIKKDDFIEKTIDIYQNHLAKVIVLDKVESF